MKEAWVSQMRKGLVELGVLSVLHNAETYGYHIVQTLALVEGLAITESTIYPVLARLEEDACISVRVAPSPNGPQRRYYRLTQVGRDRLSAMAAQWATVKASVDRLLATPRQPEAIS
ncbi:MAG: PadR family transcriptional regulator [Planctomycetes bacterium]|nr:PadR family transcriptional regulator [Planctomycetota bacterium]